MDGWMDGWMEPGLQGRAIERKAQYEAKSGGMNHNSHAV